MSFSLCFTCVLKIGIFTGHTLAHKGNNKNQIDILKKSSNKRSYTKWLLNGMKFSAKLNQS
jgi:hypothetical protein